MPRSILITLFVTWSFPEVESFDGLNSRNTCYTIWFNFDRLTSMPNTLSRPLDAIPFCRGFVPLPFLVCFTIRSTHLIGKVMILDVRKTQVS